MTCLGCAGVVCQVCEDKSNALTKLSHWPLEVSVSPAALIEIEAAIRAHDAPMAPAALDTELMNVANIIRAHLQHVLRAAAAKAAPVAPAPDEWLG